MHLNPIPCCTHIRLYLHSSVKGNVSVPDMSHFYPNGDNFNPGLHDEEYTANLLVAKSPFDALLTRLGTAALLYTE